MASITSEDDSPDDNLSFTSRRSSYSVAWDDETSEKSSANSVHVLYSEKYQNLAINLSNRELYGRFTKNPKAKTEKVFKNIHTKCRYPLSSLLEDPDFMSHIFMGFTLCGQYFLSYTEKMIDVTPNNILSSFLDIVYEYELYIWRFIPGLKLEYVSKHKIFNHLKDGYVLDRIMFMQFPNDMHKVVCYGYNESHNPDLFHVSILTLPSPSSCIHCNGSFSLKDELTHHGWCKKHGFMVHYMFATSQPSPPFDPNISLSFPNHLVINTGHHIHILNVCTLEPAQANTSLTNLIKEEETKCNTPMSNSFFNDTFSEVSESASDHFGCSSVVDAILEDFSEYDLESGEGNKPFHELNISCEPLNVTGKSYHNTLVQNIFDPRIKRLQGSSKEYVFSIPQTSTQKPPAEKSKIDKKIAEKAYEFIEENEKYEKISLFRKKRLADKKYEFSEDNTENIVPFHILRRERRFLYRSQGRSIRSPDFNTLFLSPRSPGWRSPMQSPNSRNGQFSPGGAGARHIYCTSVRSSPHHSKSPISPKESARKVNVYSPSLDSDCSDSDSRLIIKTSVNFSTSNYNDGRSNNHGLLIVDPKMEAPKWIKKVVRRYSNGDFENSSLLSGQSRDDYNNPIEIPLLVQSLTDQHFDIVPDCKVDTSERQIIVTQRSMDCEQFVQKRSQELCSETQLVFMHCDDYDIKIIYVCPLNGVILCQAVIKIGALRAIEPNSRVENYWAHFFFTWNITTDAFDIIDPDTKLYSAKEQLAIPTVKFPKFNCKKAWVLDYDTSHTSKSYLRDYNECFEICLGSKSLYSNYFPFSLIESDSDDTE